MSARRTVRRGALAFAGALSLAACDPGTRIEGTIRLAEGLEASDEERHTLYVAAFPGKTLRLPVPGGSEILRGVTYDTASVPAFVEFGGIANDDFDPEVEFALGGAGPAEELHIVVWWKIGDAEHSDYELPEPGDRFGEYEENPVFRGAAGDDGDIEKGVEIFLDRTLGAGTSG